MIPALPSITGGPAQSQSGSAGGTQSGSSGISSPVVIGGYKTDGSATAFPKWLVYGAIAAAVAAVVWLAKRRSH